MIVAPERLMPRQQGERLAEADGQGVRRVELGEARGARTDPIGDPQGDAPMTRKPAIASRTRVAVAVEDAVDQVLADEPDDRGRDRGDDQQPRQAAVAIVADPSLADAGDDGAEVAEPVAAEVDEQREQRPEVEEDVEGEAADEPRIGPAGDPRRQLEMRR